MASLRRFSIRDAAVVISVLALIAAASQIPVIARSGWSHLTEHVPSTTNRELAALVYSQAPNSTFLAATRDIPRNALYSVVVGEDPPNPAGFDVAIPGMFQYWLLPRRYTKNIHKAQYVISWHHSSETLGIRYSEELGIGDYSNVLKVVR
jgi:hypothetical protein